MLEAARKSGCMAVFIGFESVSEESLESMSKVRNLKVGVGKYKDIIKRIHDHGMGVHGAFICGSDGDGKDIFDRTAQFVLDSKIDSAQVTILTPLPGTRLYDRMRSEGRLLRTDYPEDWKHYDTAEAVFRPTHMTPDELEEGALRFYEQTTARLPALKRAFNSFVQTGNLPVTAIAYALNRGLGSLAAGKYRYAMSVRASTLEN